jgi:SAM-dependent methyltransferase
MKSCIFCKQAAVGKIRELSSEFYKMQIMLEGMDNPNLRYAEPSAYADIFVELSKRNAFVGDKKILEVGCGPGYFIYALKKSGVDVKGIELLGLPAKLGQQNKLDIRIGDAFEVSKHFKEKFDFIISRSFFVEGGIFEEYYDGSNKDHLSKFLFEAREITAEKGVHIHQGFEKITLTEDISYTGFKPVDAYDGLFGHVVTLQY